MSNIRQKLADVLEGLLTAKNQPVAQTAREIGYTRQRLHQLKTGDKTAAPEAIEEAINRLGYRLKHIEVERSV